MRLVQRFFSRWQNWGSFLLILAYVGVALAAPYLSPEDPKNPGAFLQVAARTERLQVARVVASAGVNGHNMVDVGRRARRTPGRCSGRGRGSDVR